MRTDPTYLSKIRAKYNAIDEIWSDDDPWHSWSRNQIRSEMRLVGVEFEGSFAGTGTIVDVGSAGERYFVTSAETIDIDIAEHKLSGHSLAICCSAETLPLSDNVADLAICVGPVVNYCSFEEVVEELSRVCKIGARLVLHVELSNSFEFLGQPEWCCDAAFVKSFYKGEESYWVYSDFFCRRILAQCSFAIERTRYFHFASSLAYRLSRKANLSSRLAVLDRVFSKLPGCGSLADSVIYVCYRAAC